MNMIDRKSAMMIRVNSTIISGIVVFFSHIKEIENGMFLGVVMVITSFASLVFSLFASKPNSSLMAKNHAKKVMAKYPEIAKNIFLIGMHSKVPLAEYEEAYDELVHSQSLQIGNQVRAMYVLETYIFSAFRFVDLAYGSFITGFFILIVTFAISNI